MVVKRNTSAHRGWEELATAISKNQAHKKREDGQGNPPGELIILGSGLSTADLTSDFNQQIESADYVFYCLYDQLARAHIKSLRPDAYDLFVFYQNDVDRHVTYVQMAEAMLYPVRRGQKSVAVFYGHPGVFATPTHRAIELARSEGHMAKMRPGISALDYLIADLGFDPALPGLLSYEASDMLLRRRLIDTTLHVVLWQVGVVGDFEFNHGGFANSGFGALIDRLEEDYGPTAFVTHYIAPTYPGVDALIEHFQIQELRKADVKAEIQAISTFYLEPQAPVETDRIMAEQLGLIQAGKPMPGPIDVSINSDYGPAEIDAVFRMAKVEFPEPTDGQPYGPVSLFLAALRNDASLLAKYVEDPLTAFNDSRFAALTDRAKQLLAMRHDHATLAALHEDNR